MKTISRLAPALFVLVVLVGVAVAIGLSRGEQGEQGYQQDEQAAPADNSINAGLSNGELVNRAVTSMRKVSGYHIDLSGPVSGRQSKVSLEGTVGRGSRVKFSAGAFTDNGVTVPAEEREIISTSDGQFYETIDGGKTWQVLKAEDAPGWGWEFLLTVMSSPWFDVAAPPLTFNDGDPRLEKIDGILTRHVVADLTGLAAGHSWDLAGEPATTLELWVSTDSTPLIRRLVVKGNQDAEPPATGQVTPGSGEQGVTAGEPYTLTWTWSRFNEDFGEVKPPPGMGAAEPAAAGNEIHPQKSLGDEAKADYLRDLDFSDDGALLAARVSGGAADKIVLWRVPDWKVVGVIPPGQASASLERLSVGSGAGAELLAEASAERDLVYVRRAGDKSLVATLDFRSPPGPLPEGYTFDPGSMNSTTNFVFVRTPDGKEYKLSPEPVMDWVLHSPEDYAISPDGKYIAGGYDQECVIWVWTLPDFEVKAGKVQPTATPQPQPQPQSKAGEPEYLGPFKTLDIEGAYGGDVAPEGVPGGGLFSPNGQYLVTSVHQGDVVAELNYHSSLVVWRTSDWERVLTRTLELGFPTLAFSPDSKTLAVGSNGGTVALYHTSDWAAFRTFRVPPEHMRLAFVPDGSALASASGNDETIRFWRTSDWSELRTQQIEGLCSYCYFHFSPDGKLFTAGLVDPSVINIWRVEDGSIERTIKPPEGTYAHGPSFSRDGSVIKAFVTLGKQLDPTEEWDQQMWNVADGRRVTEDPDKGTLEGAGENIYRNGDTRPVYALRRTAFADLQDTGSFGNFSPDGKTVVGTCGQHLLCLWTLPEAREQPGGGQPAAKVTSTLPSTTPTSAPEQPATPTEQARETAPPLEPLSESNISRVRELNRIFSASWVNTLAFVPGVQTTTLAIGSGGFEFWQGLDSRTERVKRLPLDEDSRLLAFSPDGQTVLTRYGIEDYTQHELRLWGVQDGEPVQTFVGHTDVVMAGALSPDGKTMASGGNDCTIRIWSVADATTLHEITLPDPNKADRGCPEVRTLAFSPDGTLLVTGSADGIRLWSTSDYSLLKTISPDYYVNAVAFSPDGKTLASGEMGGLRLWRVSDGALLHTLEKDEEHEAVAFSPDGSLLATGAGRGSRDVGAVSIWRVSDGKLLRQLEGHTGNVISLAFSPDGRMLASGSASSSFSGSGDNSTRVWGVR